MFENICLIFNLRPELLAEVRGHVVLHEEGRGAEAAVAQHALVLAAAPRVRLRHPLSRGAETPGRALGPAALLAALGAGLGAGRETAGVEGDLGV